MPALAYKISNHPVLLPLLEIFHSQRRQFGTPQTTAEENNEPGVVPLAPKTGNVYGLQRTLTLLRRKPITHRQTQAFGPLQGKRPSEVRRLL